MRRTLLALSSACVVAACGGHSLDLGNNDAGGSADGASGGNGSSGGGGGGSASPLAGKWTGYIESFQFPSGDDSLSMTFTVASDGSVSGTVVFSNQPAPPPPTNPDVGYPPGLLDGGTPNPPFWGEGFLYTATDVKFDGTRLQLGVDTNELWDAWCRLQSKTYGFLPDGGGPPYSCLPNIGFGGGGSSCFVGSPPGPTMPVDCGKLALCVGGPTGGPSSPPSGMCQCSQSSCSGSQPGNEVDFDMQLSGDHLDGSTSGLLMQHNAHLTRSH